LKLSLVAGYVLTLRLVDMGSQLVILSLC